MLHNLFTHRSKRASARAKRNPQSRARSVLLALAIIGGSALFTLPANAQDPLPTPTVTPSPLVTPTPTQDRPVELAPTPSATNPAPLPELGNGVATPTPLTPEERARYLSPQAQPTPPPPDLSRLGVNSGQTVPLTLNETIRRALENNNDIEVARDDVRFQETQLRSLEGFYDPVFNFGPQLLSQSQSQASTLGGANPSGRTTFNQFVFNAGLDRNFSRGGGTYSTFFNNNRQTNSSSFVQLNPTFNSNLGIQFTQPLLRNRSIDQQRRQIRVQRKRLQQSDADFRRTTIDIISQTQRSYWDLVFALRDQEIQVSNLNLTRENLRRVEAQIDAGAVAPLARAEVLTELANRETQVLSATQRVSIAENVLKQLLFRDTQNPEWSSALLPTDKPAFDLTPVNLEEALTEARTNRPELQNLRIGREINDIDAQFFRNQIKPRVDLTGSVALNGLSGNFFNTTGAVTSPIIVGDPTSNSSAFLLQQINVLRQREGLPPIDVPTTTFDPTTGVPSPLVGGIFTSFTNLFTQGTRTISVGVNIQIPLRNRTAEANLAGARVQRNQLESQIRRQEQTVETEVRNAAQGVETARRRVLSAREARVNAELQLAGEQRLYQVGRSTTFLLFQRQNALTNARNEELRAETDYNKALADLQRATSITLRANNVVIQAVTP